MDSKELVIVPIYWGSKWLPPADKRFRKLTFTWIDINAAMWTIMRSWYMLGLEEYGVLPGLVYPGHIIEDANDPPPQTFEISDGFDKIDQVIAAGDVPQRDAWGDDHKVLYVLFFAPESYCSNPNLFGYNNHKDEAWVTANSDLAGAIEFYAHEMVEGSSGEEIADPCQPRTVIIDQVRLPMYRSNALNTCWPTEEAVLLHRGFVKFEHIKALIDNPIEIGTH
jgi:hypothetical protein